MNNRMCKLIVFAGIFLIGLSSNISAQAENNETANVKKRAETLLQTIREEKWDELDKFVVIVAEQIDKETGKSTKIFHFVDNIETKEKVIGRFKEVYSVLKPGKIITVRVSEKDKTTAGVSYKHGDKDGFDMVLIDGERFYTIEYLK